MAANGLQAIYRYAIPLSIGFGFAQASLYDVKGGTRAVIFDRLSGVKETVVNEGTHFLIPWLQRSIIYDVRTKPRNISTTTGSKDLQMVSLTLRVLHRPEVQQLPKIYQVRSVSVRIQLTHVVPPQHTFRYIADMLSSPWVSIMMSGFSPPLEMKSSKRLLHNSTPQS